MTVQSGKLPGPPFEPGNFQPVFNHNYVSPSFNQPDRGVS